MATKKKKQQYNLIEAYNEHIIPAMEAIAREESDRGKQQIFLHEQEGRAGCHTDGNIIDAKNTSLVKDIGLGENKVPKHLCSMSIIASTSIIPVEKFWQFNHLLIGQEY